VAASASSPARLYDGLSARAHTGVVQLRVDALLFRAADGPGREWPLERVRSIERVADELHVEIAADEAAAGAVALKLVVDDPSFEAQLDAARSHFGTPGRVAGTALRRLGLRSWLVIAAVVITAAWLGVTIALPHAHVLISRPNEVALGEKVFHAVSERWQVTEDEQFAELVKTMLAELVDPQAGFDVSVTLVDEQQPNAFALPGGRIVVFAGLLRLCPSADALAGVLAHEIAHVEQRHGLKHLLRTLGVLYFAGCVVGGGVEEFASAETIGELASGLLVLKHSRDHEREADAIALQKLRRAGRAAAGLHEFFVQCEQRAPDGMTGLGWLSTHPLTSERIDACAAAGADVGARPWLEPDAWASLRARLAPGPKKR
jgi:Zn-dependent protease with chaperone function